VKSDTIRIVIWDLDGTLLDGNDAFLDMVQYDRADLAAGIPMVRHDAPSGRRSMRQEEAAELAATEATRARAHRQ